MPGQSQECSFFKEQKPELPSVVPFDLFCGQVDKLANVNAKEHIDDLDKEYNKLLEADTIRRSLSKYYDSILAYLHQPGKRSFQFVTEIFHPQIIKSIEDFRKSVLNFSKTANDFNKVVKTPGFSLEIELENLTIEFTKLYKNGQLKDLYNEKNYEAFHRIVICQDVNRLRDETKIAGIVSTIMHQFKIRTEEAKENIKRDAQEKAHAEILQKAELYSQLTNKSIYSPA